MLHLRPGFRVRHRVEFREAGLRIAVPCAPIRHVGRGMTVDARARLLRDHLPLRELLVAEHVRVAALLAKIRCEGIAGPELPRSEEHTSELQSQSNLVCRLL